MDIFSDLLTLIEIGGPVMVPICIVSAWMWVLVLLKADWIFRSSRGGVNLNNALEHLQSNTPCPISYSPKNLALHHFMSSFPEGTKIADNISEILFLEVAVRRQIGVIYRFIPTIITLAAVAPLLGLFGTVSGMVETFKVIGLYGMGNAQAMASGIREAMITTQTGLLVAIPGVLIGQVLKKKANNIHRELLVFQRGLAQWIEKEI